jgi:surface protein
MPRLSSIGSRALAGIGLKRIIAVLPAFYYPLTNTAVDPTSQLWRDEYAPAGYMFVPNNGIYANEPITNMYYMFDSSTINDPDIVLWDVSTVTIMTATFRLTSEFNQPIGSWDVSNVTDMFAMFAGTTVFNQPLGFWDVSSVTEFGMNFMFQFAVSFNQDLSNWCVTNIPSIPFLFMAQSGYNFDDPNWELNLPVWGTCPTELTFRGYAELNTQTESVTTSNYQYEFFDSSGANFGFGTYTNLVTNDSALLELTVGRTITFNFNGESPLTVTLNSNTSSTSTSVLLVWDGSAQGNSAPVSITIPGANTVTIYSIAGSADSMLAALNTLSINDTFEWTSPFYTVPTAQHTARLLSGNIGVGGNWSFRISVSLAPGSESGFPGAFSNYEVNRIFLPRP